MKSFDDIQSKFKDISLEKIDDFGSSGFAAEIKNRYKKDIKLDITKINEYDQNILKHLEYINTNKDIKITLKYFQYFILLFIEIYLDKYFNNKELFINELNNYLKFFNKIEDDNLSDYTEKDINKIAIWSATGSGKTIIMHINFLQIKYYMNKYGINFEEKILLLTPNEGLSKQHLEEFEIDRIPSSIFSKSENIQLNMNDIKIIEITKLAEKNGEKTVSVSSFGNKNIVFIDEGHRGTSGELWLTYRNKLCDNGFSIEYSATFGQAISASNNKNLEEEYAKCILFDYSYKYFYKDGYGKDFKILNLKIDIDNKITDEKNIYLIAFLLTYYQQKRVYKDKFKFFKPFNIENPLMIFIGGSVNALRKENKEEVSDVLDIINFINYFTKNKNNCINFIDRILKGTTGLLNSAKEDIFIKDFNYLTELQLTAVEIYDDMLNEIFHESISGSLLYLEHLKETDGEIRLRLGDNKPFGLINIGDAEKFIKLCSLHNINTLSINFSDSLFDSINDKNSDINLLIGSKKFIEGWNSWRVSAIGLMNIGKKEGSQIIQLFGRGVRLKGKNYSLKRSTAYFLDYPLENKDIYSDLKYLETINIFGIKADYMQQFREILESEEIEKNKKFMLNIPILFNIPSKKIINLKIKNNLDFKRDGTFFDINNKGEKFIIELDCYEKIQFTSSKGINSEDIISKKSQKFTNLHLNLLDYEKIFFELQKYKINKKYYNMSLEKKDIITLFKNSNWYKILIPEEDMKIESIKEIEKFNKIAVLLVKKYIDKKYYISKNRWEDPLLEYQFIDSTIDENQNYLIEIDNIENNQTYKIFF
ncbi:type III restriction enzyme, res subunit superfamily [Fusobacterium animalis 11_3_2]|nr:DEAD/DEAH box helicase family protein [Fusobacterium animalis]EGN63614.1 type III restriction enzyme, res subunit superfamily [Fusobacterium animalis 11_3_2]